MSKIKEFISNVESTNGRSELSRIGENQLNDIAKEVGASPIVVDGFPVEGHEGTNLFTFLFYMILILSERISELEMEKGKGKKLSEDRLMISGPSSYEFRPKYKWEED